MRIRKKKNLDRRLSSVHDYIIDNFCALKHFTQDKATHLEIGCGMGRFAIETARLNPHVALVAVEVEKNALIVAAEAAKRAEAHNLRFIAANAEQLSLYFKKGAVGRIYLNFSDPWPHSPSRRLTHPRYLRLYRHLLAPDAALYMKTDNAPLFEWSIEQFEGAGWTLFDVTRDLHESDLNYGVNTEYEERFMALGTPINALRATPPKDAPKIELFEVETDLDIQTTARLAAQIWGEHYTPILGKAHVAYMVKNLQSADAIRRDIGAGARYYLQRYDGTPAGYLAICTEADALWVSKLYVQRSLRGFGLGRAMLEKCKEQAKERGLFALRLSCNRNNAAALEAYAAYGFEIVGEKDVDIGGGFINEDYILQLLL